MPPLLWIRRPWTRTKVAAFLCVGRSHSRRCSRTPALRMSRRAIDATTVFKDFDDYLDSIPRRPGACSGLLHVAVRGSSRRVERSDSFDPLVPRRREHTFNRPELGRARYRIDNRDNDSMPANAHRHLKNTYPRPSRPHLCCRQPRSSRAPSIATQDDVARRGARQRHRGRAPGGAAAYVTGRAHPSAAILGNGDIAVGANKRTLARLKRRIDSPKKHQRLQ